MSQIVLQLQSIAAPKSDEHASVTLFYFLISAVLMTLLILSFTHEIKLVIVGMILVTIRNIIPLYNFENRRAFMDPAEWNLLVLLQLQLIILNIILLSNIMDRGFSITSIIILVLTIPGYQ